MRGSTNVVNYSELRYLLVVYGLACAVSLFRFDACRVLPQFNVGEACPVPFLLEESRPKMSERGDHKWQSTA